MATNDGTRNIENPCINCDSVNNWRAEDVFEKYLAEDIKIKDLLQSAKSDVKVKCTTLAGKARLRDIKRTEYALAEDIYKLYRDFEHCITVFAIEEAAQIKQTSLNIKAGKEEVVKAMNNASDAIKSLKGKAKMAYEAACKLDACMKDSCNAEQLSILKKLNGKNSDSDCDEKKGNDGKNGKNNDTVNVENGGVIEEIGQIILCIKDGHTTANHIFEQSIQLASVLARINVDDIATRTQSLQSDIEGFQKNVVDNRGATQEAMTASATQYNQGLTEFSASYGAVAKAKEIEEGLLRVKKDICYLKKDPNCHKCNGRTEIEPLAIDSLNDDICAEVRDGNSSSEQPQSSEIPGNE
jgi:hypothetical protein